MDLLGELVNAFGQLECGLVINLVGRLRLRISFLTLSLVNLIKNLNK